MNTKEITVQETKKSETQAPKEKKLVSARRLSFQRSYAMLPEFSDLEEYLS